MKFLFLAAALATATVLPVVAEDAPAQPPRPPHGQFHKEREGVPEDRPAMHEEHREKHDAMRQACEARMKAATTPEAKLAERIPPPDSARPSAPTHASDS